MRIDETDLTTAELQSRFNDRGAAAVTRALAMLELERRGYRHSGGRLIDARPRTYASHEGAQMDLEGAQWPTGAVCIRTTFVAMAGVMLRSNGPNDSDRRYLCRDGEWRPFHELAH